MFKKLIEKWKNEWVNKHYEELEKEFSAKTESLRIEFSKKEELIKSSWDKRLKELNEEIEKESSSLDEMKEKVIRRKEELERENENLKEQIRIIEAKSSPSSIWENAVGTGWKMAWDLMLPIVNESISKVKNLIELKAVEDTLDRNNIGRQKNTVIGNFNTKEIHNG